MREGARSRLAHAIALAAIVFVPLVACGGLVALREQDAGADAQTPPSTTATPTSSGTSSTTATGTGAPTSTSTGTSSASPTATSTGSSAGDAGFGPFPCLAYTVWYESCPPTAGTSGCFYTVPIASADPANGWTNLSGYVAAPGCKLEITLPDSEPCGSAHCFCGTDDKWAPDPVDAGQFGCPTQ